MPQEIMDGRGDEREPADEHVRAFERYLGVDSESLRIANKPFWQARRRQKLLHALIAGDRALALIGEDDALDPTQSDRWWIRCWQRDVHEAFKQDRATDNDLALADELTDLARRLTEQAERKRKGTAQTAEAQKSRADAAETRRKAILQEYRSKKKFPRHGDGAKLAKQYQVSRATISADLEWIEAQLRK